ncbi:TraX family protein [Haloimpatiens sp. FM7315]|uniref:TraX family protein n=1 Tax=Haloimpatiens sp. FM7315 TaxID=3298609 RepID=UPI00370CC389
MIGATRKFRLNATELKLVAIITMLIDHIGAVLYPKVLFFRIIGRLAFPIFCYFISEGFFKTSNVKKYMKRLFVFALISQVPFYLAFRTGYYLNVFFTLFFGLYAVISYDRTKEIKYVWFLGMIAQVLNTDYGIYGVFMIYFFYKYHNDFRKMFKSQAILTFIFLGVLSLGATINLVISKISLEIYFSGLISIWIEAFCLLSLFLIRIYNGEKGKGLKYLFYVFYPAHLLIIAGIKKIFLL